MGQSAVWGIHSAAHNKAGTEGSWEAGSFLSVALGSALPILAQDADGQAEGGLPSLMQRFLHFVCHISLNHLPWAVGRVQYVASQTLLSSRLSGGLEMIWGKKKI